MRRDPLVAIELVETVNTDQQHVTRVTIAVVLICAGYCNALQ
jgi:hypothetical protein